MLTQRLTRGERQAQTRQALLDAAARVFVKRGFTGSSVEEISAEAGYTRGAFYSNFRSKNELFVALLHERVYAGYTAMTQEGLRERPPTLRETGERLAAMQANPEGRWLWRLWFECLAQAGRDEELRELAATFWQGNRERITKLIEIVLPHQKERGKPIASALIALDIGLAIQHFVDPDDVPLALYPELYVLLFGHLAQAEDAMSLEEAIRTRRTHKAFASEPVSRELLDELLELARWAPNHHLTNPWRFRVLGPRALARLKQAAGPEAAAKLDRAPTLVAASAVRSDDPVQDEEDLCATACAVYAVLLGAHARGLAGYWRTPGVLRTRPGLEALAIPDTERFVALIHLGRPRQEKDQPGRLPPADYVTYLG